MSIQIPQVQIKSPPVAESAERTDVLRLIREWLADRFAEGMDVDTSIDWEDGEEHDDEALPPAA